MENKSIEREECCGEGDDGHVDSCDCGCRDGCHVDSCDCDCNHVDSCDCDCNHVDSCDCGCRDGCHVDSCDCECRNGDCEHVNCECNDIDNIHHNHVDNVKDNVVDCDCGCRDGVCTCVGNDQSTNVIVGDISITDLINKFIAYGNPSFIPSSTIDINDPTFQSSVMLYLKRFENDIKNESMIVHIDNMYRNRPPQHAVYTGFKLPSLSLTEFYQRFFRCRFDMIPSYTLVKTHQATAEELFAMDAYSAYMKEHVNRSIHYTVTGDVDENGKWHWKRCIHGVSPYDVHYTDTFDSDEVDIDPLYSLDEDDATNYFDIEPLL